MLLLTRFDRTSDGERVGYLSASSLVEAEESVGGDYAFIGDALAEQDSANLPVQLRELWRRVAFDVNPNPDAGAARATSISGADLPAHEAQGLLDLADDLGIGQSEALAILAQVVGAVSGWRKVARQRGLGIRAIDGMAGAFEPAHDRLLRMLDDPPAELDSGRHRPRQPKGPGGRFSSKPVGR